VIPRATFANHDKPFRARTVEMADLENVVISAFARSYVRNMRSDLCHLQRKRRDDKHTPPTLSVGLGKNLARIVKFHLQSALSTACCPFTLQKKNTPVSFRLM
jgi:hypothetical protein